MEVHGLIQGMLLAQAKDVAGMTSTVIDGL
jgi:hypothetical protein